MYEIHRSGRKKLSGSIAVGGAKTARFRYCRHSFDGAPTTLHNIPDIADIRNMLSLVEALGVEVSFENHTLIIHARN